MRHAKSSREDPSLQDYDRPLNERWKHDAKLMWKVLAKSDVAPQLVVCSWAKRTQQTAKKVLKALEYPMEDMQVTDALYEASPDQIRSVLSTLPEEIDCCLLFAHNPWLEELVNACWWKEQHLPTGGVAELVFDIASWSHIDEHLASLKSFDFPKNHY